MQRLLLGEFRASERSLVDANFVTLLRAEGLETLPAISR